MTGASIGLLLGLGCALVLLGWRRGRVPTLRDRLLPYVRDVTPLDAVRGPGPSREQVLAWLTHRLGLVLGGTESVEARLRRLGGRRSVQQFRVEQLVAGAAGFGVAATVSAWWLVTTDAPAVSLVVLCVAAFGAGLVVADVRLSSRVRAREERMREELPAVAELLALAVAAGEGATAGLERVVAVTHGDLSDELRLVLGEVRTGTTMVDAFDGLAARTGVAGIARFAEAVAVAIDRGTPLVDVLHAHATDVREAGRRELMELGGRKEVAMMLPVVFLILPVTVVFAFFPGLVGLHLSGA